MPINQLSTSNHTRRKEAWRERLRKGCGPGWAGVVPFRFRLGGSLLYVSGVSNDYPSARGYDRTHPGLAFAMHCAPSRRLVASAHATRVMSASATQSFRTHTPTGRRTPTGRALPHRRRGLLRARFAAHCSTFRILTPCFRGCTTQRTHTASHKK